MGHPYYVLRGDPPEAMEATYEEWAASMEDFESRRVGSDHVVGSLEEAPVWVSTVLMSMDPMLKGPLFETMVFGLDLDGRRRRYRTYEAALKGHDEMVERVKLSEKTKEARP